MKWAWLVALLIAGSSAAGAETACRRVNKIFPEFDKPRLRKINSPKDPLFGHLIGRSKAHVRKCQGEPSKETPDSWTYVERLGPGAHTSQHSWVVKFEQDEVVEVEVNRIFSGCMLVPPPR